jgi:hypothetical protein
MVIISLIFTITPTIMSFNIKVNPFAQIGVWNGQGLDAVISVLPTPPTIEEVIKANSDYVSSKMFNAAIYADIDGISIQENMSSVINFMTSNSWCQDCCDTTFDSFKKLKAGINTMTGFSTAQQSYINQFLGVPCNPQITVLGHISPILQQLQTSIIIDMSLSDQEKYPLMVLSAIAIEAIDYWENQSTLGPATWNQYMIPAPAIDWIRPFWLYNMLGTVIGMHFGMADGGGTGTNLSITGLSGGMVAVSGYAIFK